VLLFGLVLPNAAAGIRFLRRMIGWLERRMPYS